MYDFITIGSATQDVFIQSDVASIVTVSQMAKKSEFMSFPYGAKTEIADFSKNLGVVLLIRQQILQILV